VWRFLLPQTRYYLTGTKGVGTRTGGATLAVLVAGIIGFVALHGQSGGNGNTGPEPVPTVIPLTHAPTNPGPVPTPTQHGTIQFFATWLAKGYTGTAAYGTTTHPPNREVPVALPADNQAGPKPEWHSEIMDYLLTDRAMISVKVPRAHVVTCGMIVNGDKLKPVTWRSNKCLAGRFAPVSDPKTG
jgi:hypothetical protein